MDEQPTFNWKASAIARETLYLTAARLQLSDNETRLLHAIDLLGHPVERDGHMWSDAKISRAEISKFLGFAKENRNLGNALRSLDRFAWFHYLPGVGARATEYRVDWWTMMHETTGGSAPPLEAFEAAKIQRQNRRMAKNLRQGSGKISGKIPLNDGGERDSSTELSLTPSIQLAELLLAPQLWNPEIPTSKLLDHLRDWLRTQKLRLNTQDKLTLLGAVLATRERATTNPQSYYRKVVSNLAPAWLAKAKDIAKETIERLPTENNSEVGIRKSESYAQKD